MFSKSASKLDHAIIASVAAMLAVNVFVLSQQLSAMPQVAAAPAAPTALQA